MKVQLLLLCAFQILDTLLSDVRYEANPIAQRTLSLYGSLGFLGIKLALVLVGAMGAYCWYWGFRSYRFPKVLFSILNIVMSTVCFWNLLMIVIGGVLR